MSMFNELIGVAGAFLVVAVSPGPANIATATIAIRFGRRAALEYGLGLSIGLAFWGLIAVTGLGIVFQASFYLFTAVKIVGGIYLLWLALQSLRAFSDKESKEVKLSGEGHWFWRGLVLNLFNPKAVLAWMAVLAVGLSADGSHGVMGIATMVCVAIGFGNYAMHALVFSISGVMHAYRRCSRWVEGAVAGVFAVTGLGLIRSALTR
ncbi:LysE family translocator [Allorhizobium sp. BGMRC 0089]|uniref:LysE family translocator n=1 Tax=Allorhizobium sonneratiae TaxID=2934936 RepID=UPI002033C3C6|nr:LysE family translocator [Allorhizobium sonneratiae]MCM2294750.1 LysE family translocator [Allorhizobium sonneratiae]